MADDGNNQPTNANDTTNLANLLQSMEERLIKRMDEKIGTAMQQLNPAPQSQLSAGATSLVQSGQPREGQQTVVTGDVRPPWDERSDIPNYDDDISHFWQDDDVPTCPAKLSESLTEIVKDSFTTTLSNSSRRELRNKCPTPETVQTRCPRVDAVFKTPESRFSKNVEGKSLDNDFMKIQAFMLDVASPLTELLQGLESGVDLPRPPEEALQDALKLLGNAVAQTSKIRRKRILKICNPDIQDLADNDELYKEAPPNLFGENFEKKMKERAESVKLLSKSQTSSQSGTKPFFRNSHTQRGSGSTRGSRGRYSPYGTFQNARGNWNSRNNGNSRGGYQSQRRQNK